MIQSTGHGTSVDWWSLGILVFEMLAGYPPFWAPPEADQAQPENAGHAQQNVPPVAVYRRILEARIEWPTHFDDNAQVHLFARAQQRPQWSLLLLVIQLSSPRPHKTSGIANCATVHACPVKAARGPVETNTLDRPLFTRAPGPDPAAAHTGPIQAARLWTCGRRRRARAPVVQGVSAQRECLGAQSRTCCAVCAAN